MKFLNENENKDFVTEEDAIKLFEAKSDEEFSGLFVPEEFLAETDAGKAPEDVMTEFGPDVFTTKDAAEKRAKEMGQEGSHEVQFDGKTYYMPCPNHDAYMNAMDKEEDMMEGSEIISATIKKEGDEWVVYSNSGKKMGSYKSKKEAEDRLKQIEMFKHIKENKGESEESDAGDTYRNKLDPKSPHDKQHRKIKMVCRKCGSRKNIDLHHKGGSRSDLNSTKNIIPLCRKCHRKLHQGKGSLEAPQTITASDSSFSDFIGKIDINVPNLNLTAIGVKILKLEEVDEKSLAKANLNKQEDLMYVVFKLVHVGTNGNKDTFLEEELIKAEKTPILKGLNWGHSDENIGVIYDSKYIPTSDQEPGHIICAAAIWKYKYPRRAEEIATRFYNSNLYFSMETYFKEVACSNCSQRFVSGLLGLCEHLNERFTATSDTSRVLYGLTFGGAAVEDRPADPQAVPLALARKEEIEENKTKGVNLMEEKFEKDLKVAQDELAKATEKISEVTKTKETVENEKKEVETKLGAFTAELETVKAERVTLTQQLEEANKELTALKQKFVEIEAEKNANVRYDALASFGYGPSRDDATFAEHIGYLKSLSEDAYNAMLKVLKEAKPVVEANKAVAKKTIPAGDADTGDKTDRLVTLKKVLSI